MIACVSVFSACSDDDDDDIRDDDELPGDQNPDPERGNAFLVLTADNRLLTVYENDADDDVAEVAITGIAAGETLQAIDVRPINGRLYGLATNGSMAHLYHIDVRDGVATQIGVPFQYATGDGAPVAVTGTDIDIDFNPLVDRIRLITSDGLNARINPNTGAPVDGDNGSTAGSVNNTNPDGNQVTGLGGAAYTNSTHNPSVTTLYTVRYDGTTLALQNPPNAGTQVSVGAINVNGSPIEPGIRVAFDIPRGVTTAANNAGVSSGSGYLGVVRSGGSQLYRLDLSTGAATSLGDFDTEIRDFAVWTPEALAFATTEPAGTPVLSRFLASNPGELVSRPITGVALGESFAGVTIRPATGQMYGLGYGTVTNTATLYLVDPFTAAATVVGEANNIQFRDQDDDIVPLADLKIAVNNPADRIRVVGSNGVNFRVHPDTGEGIDGNYGLTENVPAGTNPDGTISGASTRADAVAYIDRAPDNAAELFVIADTNADVIATSESPNTGAVTAVGPLGIDAAGFAALADGPAGSFFGAFQVNGVTGLYNVSTSTGAATFVATIGGGETPVSSLVTVIPATNAVRLTRP